MIPSDRVTEDLLRHLAPHVLGALVRRYGHFDAAEDAVQDASLAAAQQWPGQGRPDDPRAWLIQVGSRRLIDALRSDASRRARRTPRRDWSRSSATRRRRRSRPMTPWCCCSCVLTPRCPDLRR